jgi:hypothetical protein
VADEAVGRAGCVIETAVGRVDARLETQLAALERALTGADEWPDIDLGKAFARLEAATPRRESGRVTEVTGLVIRASVPGVRVGELVTISGAGGKPDAAPLRAEVVGFRGDEIVLMPLGEATGIGPGLAGHADQSTVLDRRVRSTARARPRRSRHADRRRRTDRGRARLGRRPARARSAVAPARQPPAAARRARAGCAADRR